MTITLTPDRRVRLIASIDLPMSTRRLWSEIADLPKFAAHDFFHAHFELPQGALEAGAPLQITHRYGPFCVKRVGKVLRYRPGVGYAFSDLSRRAKTAGFPHIFAYRIEPLSPLRSRLHLTICGRWTMPMLPRPFARVWLWWVFFQIRSAVELELLMCCPPRRCTLRDVGYTPT